MAAQSIQRVLPNPQKARSEVIILTKNTMRSDTNTYVHYVKMDPNDFKRDENPKCLPNFTDIAITNEGTLLGA